MISPKVLVILSAPVDSISAVHTILRAQAEALRPSMLRFALPASLYGRLLDLPEDAPLLFYEDGRPDSLLAELTDETHFLLLAGEYAFANRWDALLLRIHASLGQRTLLTGCMTPCADPSLPSADVQEAPTVRLPKLGGNLGALRQSLSSLTERRPSIPVQQPPPSFSSPAFVPSQPHLPALKEGVGEDAVAIGRGLALVCAQASVSTLLIDPALLFGAVDFLLDSDLTPDTLSLSAYVLGYAIFALHKALLWPLSELPRRMLARPAPEALPGTTLARFEQLLGFRYGQRRGIGKAAMGLFGHDDTYEQRMPVTLHVNHKLRTARMLWQETHMPLFVSALIDLPASPISPVAQVLRFGFLRRIESLPLTLFTGGSQERTLRASFPNTQSYPANALLPRTLMEAGLSEENHFRRSKPLLMMRAAKKQIEFTHAAWVDADILPHPICPEAVPHFEPLMDERIHLATVGGVPDPSFILIPVKYLPQIAKETLSITQLDAELKRGFSEELLWERLFMKKPEWFAIHRMPRKKLLFLSLFDRELLSHSLAAQLSDLPKPYYATAEDAAPRKRSRIRPKEIDL